MKLNLDALRQCPEFQVIPGKIDGKQRYLILPERTKHTWRDDEKHLRSLITDEHGDVRGPGLPKFLNFHEDPKHAQEMVSAERLEYREKYDGTLIIGWWDDESDTSEMKLRTRGAFDLGDFAEVVEPLAHKFARDLGLDARTMHTLVSHKAPRTKVSFLWEYIGPDNLIVVPYPYPQLACLGISVAREDGLHFFPAKHILPDFFDRSEIMALTQLPPVLVAEHVAQWLGQLEGVVAYVYSESRQTAKIIKFKTEWYVKLHGALTGGERKKIDVILDNALFSAEKFRVYFQELGYDWETRMYLWDTRGYGKVITELSARLQHAGNYIRSMQPFAARVASGELTRKDYASHAFIAGKELAPIGFGLLSNPVQANTAMLSYATGIPSAALLQRPALPVVLPEATKVVKREEEEEQ